MSYNIFFCSDHHFGHSKLYDQFTRPCGKFVRYDLATNADEGNELIVSKHNSVVRPEDRVYFVGDVAISHKALPILSRMNGRKVLIKGNHDIHKLSHYLPHFDDIRGSHQFSGILITHIPVHADSLSRWGFNIHGHLHSNRVLLPDGNVDSRYFNVSLECINYTPMSLEEIQKFKP